MSKPAGPKRSILYEAEDSHRSAVHEMRDLVGSICGSHLNKRVRVETVDGHTYEGTIVHVDRGYVYLQCAVRDPRSFYSPATAVLPLVLYELLVITLLQ